MAKPVVIVVGADKGGVGKTTVSRTLLDYFSANNIPTGLSCQSRAAPDAFPPNHRDRRHDDDRGQMKIFDTLNVASPPSP
jgi:hypothetical protein